MNTPSKRAAMNFKTIAQVEVPQGRNGKHKQIVTRMLSDLDQLQNGTALKVPLAELAESKEKVRSALNRATRKSGRSVATAHRRQVFICVERGIVVSNELESERGCAYGSWLIVQRGEWSSVVAAVAKNVDSHSSPDLNHADEEHLVHLIMPRSAASTNRISISTSSPRSSSDLSFCSACDGIHF